MLKVYHSNRLEILFGSLCSSIEQPLASPLAPEIIVVQSHGMARWFSLELAKRRGICANYEFPFPASFVWRLLKVVDRFSEGMSVVYELDNLVWAILKHLDHLLSTPAFAEVRNFLDADRQPGRRYELAHRIAGVFDQYTAYRPDWIGDWEAGKATHWQAELWRSLGREYGRSHRASLMFELLERFDESVVQQAGIPERISLIGIPALPLSQLEIFSKLAEFTDVRLFLLNPCQVYWDEIISRHDLARISLMNISTLDGEADLYFETGNSLLASFGKLGREFQRILHGYDYEEVRHFEDPGTETLLGTVQSDILHAYDRGDGEEVLSIKPDDRSIQVHAAHSAMREVEILRDQLLDLFQAKSGAGKQNFKPGDVVVMTPDIGLYAPFIEAVFASPEDDKLRIPFSIADRSIGQESVLIRTFLALIKMASGRLTSNEVLSLLDCEPVRKRFTMGEEDVETVKLWVKDTAIHWGIDKGHREQLGLPSSQRGTWKGGISRLLLGYALSGERRFYKDILPYDGVEGGGGELLGLFVGFCNEIFTFVSGVNQPRSLEQWSHTLFSALERFFVSDNSHDHDIQLLRTALDDLGQIAELVGYRGPVHIEEIAAHLKRVLKEKVRVGNFLDGRVTFCQMVPMRSIPFKVVCLLGMNDEAFPRIERLPGFDLMTDNHRLGDRLRRDDDRYLFLEAILSARDCLYISFVGRGIRDNSSIPPSPVVDELLDYIRQACRLERDAVVERLVTVHPLQPFSRRYFADDKKLFSYSRRSWRIARSDRGSRCNNGIFAKPLPTGEAEMVEIELNDFIRFFSNPTRFLLREKLGLLLDDVHDEIAERELFSLNPLEKYQLVTELIGEELAGEDIRSLLPIYEATGKIPAGAYGTLTYLERVEVAQSFANGLHEHLNGDKPRALEIDLSLGRIHLTGRLEVWPGGQYLYRPTKSGQLNFRDTIKHWLLHLLLNRIDKDGHAKKTIFICTDGNVQYPPLEDAEEQLDILADIFKRGLVSPLPLFPQASYKYATQLWGRHSGGSLGELAAQAYREAARLWHEGRFLPGSRQVPEKMDPYFRVAFGETDPLQSVFFHEAAETVLRPALERRIKG